MGRKGQRFSRFPFLAGLFVVAVVMLVYHFMPPAAFGMPLHPDTLAKIRAEFDLLRQQGVDRTVIQSQIAQALEFNRRIRASGVEQPSRVAAPVVGTWKALVIVVDFSDKAAKLTPAHFQDMLFSVGTFPSGSLRDYYLEVSYGRLDVVGIVVPEEQWLRAPQPLAFYVNYGDGSHGLEEENYPNNAQRLAEDAVILLDQKGFDFTPYDNDGDGFVDALFIIHAGQGAEVTKSNSDLWSHKWHTHQKVPVGGGKVIYEYTMEPELGSSPTSSSTIGVFAHEFGHTLGLPDLYDTDYSSAGAGIWSLMAAGAWAGPNDDGSSPAHLDAWSKSRLGWVNVQVPPAGSTKVSLPQVEVSDLVFKLPTLAQGEKAGKEYFLVENRQLVGFDAFLPGPGLLIWHVDETASGNDDEEHPLLALEQADGKDDLGTAEPSPPHKAPQDTHHKRRGGNYR